MGRGSPKEMKSKVQPRVQSGAEGDGAGGRTTYGITEAGTGVPRLSWSSGPWTRVCLWVSGEAGQGH